jgi:hypothetical protein
MVGEAAIGGQQPVVAPAINQAPKAVPRAGGRLSTDISVLTRAAPSCRRIGTDQVIAAAREVLTPIPST